MMKDPYTVSSLIQNIPKLHHMLQDVPAEILGRYAVKKFPVNTVIVRKDEEISNVYIICTGMMRIVNDFDNGRLYAFTDTNLYNLIGETEILAGVRYYGCTVESVTDCMTVLMSREDFLASFECSGVFAREIARDIAYKLHLNSSRMGENIFYPLMYHLISLLIVTAEKDLKHQESVLISLKRQDIADRLGISLRSVNRLIKKLKEAGTVSIEKGKIRMDKQQNLKLVELMNQLK